MIAIPPKYQGAAYVDTNGAMEVLGTKRDHFYTHVYPAILRRDIASIRIGTKRMISVQSLLRWAEGQNGDTR